MELLGKIIACGLLLAAAPGLAQSPGAAPVAELNPANLAVAEEIIALAFPPASRQQMLLRAIDMVMAQARAAAREASGGQIDAGMERIVDRHLAELQAAAEPLVAQYTPPIFAAMARAYARNFSNDELVQIRAFVATPAGSKYLQRSMEMVGDPDIAAANTQYMRQAIGVIEPIQTRLRAELLEYLGRRQAQSVPPRP